MGTTIPKAVIVSRDQTTLYAQLSYKQLRETKEYSAAGKVVKSALEGDLPVADPKLEPAWYFKNSNKFHYATFVELQEGETLVLEMKKSGKSSSFPLRKMSEGAAAYAKILEGKRTGVIEEEVKPPMLEVEFWGSSTAGKTIEATFVSLVGDKVTLKKKNGKKMSFSLSLLSEESQERAKLLGSQ